MEFLLTLLPAAGCAAVVFVCFRMMRYADMHSGQLDANDELASLREEMAAVRIELERTRSTPTVMSDR